MFFQVSPVRANKKNTKNVSKKENESEKVETLSLAPFTACPKLFFENIKLGETASRKLLIKNDTSDDVFLFLGKTLPENLQVTFSWTQGIIKKKDEVLIELLWNPLEEEASRHIITLEDGKKIRKDIPIVFKCINPVTKKHIITKKYAETQTKKKSPTKRYYQTRPTGATPKKFTKKISGCGSPAKSIKNSSPNFKDYYSLNNRRSQSFNSNKENTPPQKKYQGSQNKGCLNPSNNFNTYLGSNEVFLSPKHMNFQLESQNPRRETYVLKTVECDGKKNKLAEEVNFDDSLENVKTFPRKPLNTYDNVPTRSYLGNKFDINEKENVGFEQRLLQTESFCFTPESTPQKKELDLTNFAHFRPRLSSSLDEELNKPKISEEVIMSPSFTETYVHPEISVEYYDKANLSGRTFAKEFLSTGTYLKDSSLNYSISNLSPGMCVINNLSGGTYIKDSPIGTETCTKPNLSTGTYVKSNLSGCSYIRDGSISAETYLKHNLSGGTYIKESPVGNVNNLSVSPESVVVRNPFSPDCPRNISASSLFSDSARNIIEANLWTSETSGKHLQSIKEELSIINLAGNGNSYQQRSFLKRKLDLKDYTVSKRANLTVGPINWSLKGGLPYRVTKEVSGLHILRQSSKSKKNSRTEEVTSKEVNQIVIQNPFILAATNKIDPFMTSNLHVNEEWVDQQQRDFKKWLNALLSPPEDLRMEEQTIDVAKLWQECKKQEVENAPSKEMVSGKYHTNKRLEYLRKSAQNLFRSEEITLVLMKVMQSIDKGKLSIRSDKQIYLNINLKSEITRLLLSYNPLWLRIGLETIFNEIIPLKSNSDIMGLSFFIVNRVLKDPYLLKKHKSIHSPKYSVDFNKFFLKKFFTLVYFLDQAKTKKLITHDPCLFCKNSEIKDSKSMLIALAKEILAAVGDIVKTLKYLGYIVNHTQTYINEFDYSIKNLGVDLRDGVRLAKVMEIILLKEGLTSKLRVPAISRLQKVYNMKLVFDSLEAAGFNLLYDICHKDIVNGHKEKTLSFIWQIIYKFEAPLMVKNATIIQRWFRSLPIVLKRRKFEKEWKLREAAALKIQTWYKRLAIAKRLEEFIVLFRCYLERKKFEIAAIKIQAFYRMSYHKRIYKEKYRSVTQIQRFAKGWLVRNVLKVRIQKVIYIQKNVRMFLARKRFLNYKKAVDKIHNWYKSIKAMEKERKQYLALKKSAIVFEQQYLALKMMKIQRKLYLRLKSAVKVTEDRYKAKTEMRKQRNDYLKFRKATIVIQRYYRAKKLMVNDRNYYKNLKSAAVLIQSRYRANCFMKIQYTKFQNTKAAAVKIQRWFRGLMEMRKHRDYYIALKKVVLNIEDRYKARKSMCLAKKEFIDLKTATIIIQHRFRAMTLMKKQRIEYQTLLKSTVLIQNRFLANRQMKIDRKYYLKLKKNAMVIQQRYRANKLSREKRIYYLQIRETTIFIQKKWISNKLCLQQRTAFKNLKNSVLFVQRLWRAKITARKVRSEFTKVKKSVLIVQRRWRALKQCKIQREYYLVLKETTVFVQRKWIANKLRLQQRSHYINLRNSVITIQRLWKAKILSRKAVFAYTELRKSVVNVQQRWRALKQYRIQREYYIVLKKTALFIQRSWTANKLCLQQRTYYQNLRKNVINIQRLWRAKVLARKALSEYTDLRKSVINVQQRWRAIQQCRTQKQYYMALRKSTIFIQRQWIANKLCLQQRTNFEILRTNVITIQRLWRAKFLARKTFSDYIKLKKAVLNVQQRWRALQQYKIQREYYISLKRTTLFIQRRWIANQLCLQQSTYYKNLKKSVIIIQRFWRAKVLARKAISEYTELRKSVINMQQRWRANQQCSQQRKYYLGLKKTAIFIQRIWKANKLCFQQRTQYQNLRNGVITLQRQWRAKVLARKAFSEYIDLRKSVVNVQQRWRALQQCKIQRENYIVLKETTIFIQRRWIANKLCLQHKTYYILLKRSVVTIQRLWRAKILGRIALFQYTQLKNSVVNVQQRWRARQQCRSKRTYYMVLKEKTIFIQRRWIANKLCLQQRTYYKNLKHSVIFIQRRWRANKVAKMTREDYLMLKATTIFIQQHWRAKKLMEIEHDKYKSLKKAAITVQNQYRAKILMKKAHESFVKLKLCTIKIQVYFRGYLEKKKLRADFLKQREKAVLLQKCVRGFLVRKRYAPLLTPVAIQQRRIRRIQNESATKIQAAFRGYLIRKRENMPALTKIRQNTLKANASASAENTLNSRCEVALELMVSEGSTISVILKILEDLDFITRHCKNICIRLAYFLPAQLYKLMKSTNRSLPEIQACASSIHILINFYKFPSTKQYSFIPCYLDDILTVMVNCCDKEAALFSVICTLLWLFAHEQEWKEVIKKLPNINQKLFKIQTLVARKQGMVKRTGVKGHSWFAPYRTLPLPSLTASWGIEYANKPNTFSNSVHALSSLLSILDVEHR